MSTHTPTAALDDFDSTNTDTGETDMTNTPDTSPIEVVEIDLDEIIANVDHEQVDADTEAIVAAMESSESAYRGNLDPRTAEAVNEAYQILLEYATQDDDGQWVPAHVESFQHLATAMADVSGLAAVDVLFKMQKTLKEHRFDLNSRDDRRRKNCPVMGVISWDLSPTGEYVQTLGHPSQPAVIFMELDPHSNTYRAPEVDPETGEITKLGRTAAAFWFQPEVEDTGAGWVATNARQSKKGRWYSDDTHLPGYTGIVRWFASLQDCDDAMKEMNRAVNTIGKAHQAQSADVHDTVQDTLDGRDDPDAKAKRAAARRRRLTVAF